MEILKPERRKLVTIPYDELEVMLVRAAEYGAKRALADVGLDEPDAAQDIRELRSLLDAFNEAKKTVALTIVKMLTTGMILALMAGAFLKIKMFGNH